MTDYMRAIGAYLVSQEVHTRTTDNLRGHRAEHADTRAVTPDTGADTPADRADSAGDRGRTR
ncbi:hypothetical protein [Nocardia sp. BMG51109]|uniref:hypothetical protein n=1 Tax=Nocardia sp. BMG51109 TaxID=1056816 RepID=UPI0004654640|nr:hypothetical protein [Nocardia sp. BMG51109]